MNLKYEIPENVVKKLERMSVLNAAIRTNGGWDEEVMDEFRAVQAEMVEAFLPLVRKFIEAGLLGVYLPIEDIEENLDKYDGLLGDPTSVSVNGNFQINAEYSGGSYRQADA